MRRGASRALDRGMSIGRALGVARCHLSGSRRIVARDNTADQSNFCGLWRSCQRPGPLSAVAIPCTEARHLLHQLRIAHVTQFDNWRLRSVVSRNGSRVPYNDNGGGGEVLRPTSDFKVTISMMTMTRIPMMMIILMVTMVMMMMMAVDG